jgi:hypothetical protein
MQDSTVPPGSMSLLLSDFCPDGTVSAEHDLPINVTHAELASLLSEAEREEAIAEVPSSPSSSGEGIPFVSKWKRVSTLKLTLEDESAFVYADQREDSSFSSADAVDVVPLRVKRFRTRSQVDPDVRNIE